MRTIFHIFVYSVFFVSAIRAQTITVEPLGFEGLCNGERFVVEYTADGPFQEENVFTVQISGPGGSFESLYSNVGSVKSTTSGQIVATVPPNLRADTMYRIRVISSMPFSGSQDNGTNLSFGPKPDVRIDWDARPIRAGLVGDTMWFAANEMETTEYKWDFGQEASPSHANGRTVAVVYTTPGWKDLSVIAVFAGGCADTIALSSGHERVYVGTCRPVIPGEAQIDSIGRTESGPWSGSVWVKPGGDFAGGGEWEVFAEPAASASFGGSENLNVYYLKSGASLQSTSYRGPAVIYERGASIVSDGASMIECDSLVFDYSEVMKSSVALTANASIQVFPSLASTQLVVRSTTSNVRSISIVNALGVEVDYRFAGSDVEYLFDVSKLSPGLYFVHINTASGSDIRKFIIAR